MRRQQSGDPFLRTNEQCEIWFVLRVQLTALKQKSIYLSRSIGLLSICEHWISSKRGTNIFEHYVNIKGCTLNWFKSYLNTRTFSVRSSKTVLTCGVPQGSILAPFCFLYNMFLLCSIFNNKHRVSFHCYAVLFQPNKNCGLSALTSCSSDIKAWMSLNILNLNESKVKLNVKLKTYIFEKASLSFNYVIVLWFTVILL